MIDVELIGKPGHMEKIVNLVNKFQEDITNIVDPRDYHENIEDFVNLIITGFSMPVADVIYKLSGLCGKANTEDYEKEFIKKLQLAIKWRKLR